MKKPTALGISRSGGARNPHVFQYTLRFLRSGGTRPPFARDGFFTNSETNLGLLGPIIITARGRANRDGTPRQVDREFVTAWFIFDEAQGEERGLMHAVNGYIFGNLPGLVMNNGDRVRWYSLGMGSERDLHTPHWHGKTLRYNRRQTDVIEPLPGSMTTADMNANNPGTWLLHCHVGDHIENGMQARYQILH